MTHFGALQPEQVDTAKDRPAGRGLSATSEVGEPWSDVGQRQREALRSGFSLTRRRVSERGHHRIESELLFPAVAGPLASTFR
jgi:hypothetical protein